MKTQFLLPTRFKKLGLCMLVPLVIMAALQVFGGETLTRYTYWELPLPAIYDGLMGDGKWFSMAIDTIYDEIWTI